MLRVLMIVFLLAGCQTDKDLSDDDWGKIARSIPK